MNPSPNQFMPHAFPQVNLHQFPNQPLNVNMNINLLQGELNVNSYFAPHNNNFNQVNNNFHQNLNENVYFNNFNNLYNNMKNNNNVKRVVDKKK